MEMGFTGFYWVYIGYNLGFSLFFLGFCWIVLHFTGFYWVFIGY